MLKLTMFGRSKPRGFKYNPIHYDPAQEAREQRRKELLGEDAQSPLDKERKDGEYIPGQYVRSGGIRRSREGISSRESEKSRATNVRTGIALGALVAIALWMYVDAQAALVFIMVVAVIGLWTTMRSNNRRTRNRRRR